MTQGALVARQERRESPWVSPEVQVRPLRRMPEDEVRAMVADYRSGIGSWRLARQYGVSDSTVLAHVKAAGVEIEDPAQRHAANRALTTEMRRLRDKGWTLAAIGEKFGVTRQAISMRLARASDKRA